MVQSAGRVPVGNEEISLRPEVVVVPTFRTIQEVQSKLFGMLEREIKSLPSRSPVRRGFLHERNNIWTVESSVRRRELPTKGVRIVRGINRRIAELTVLFDARVTPLHAELTNFLGNSNAVLADDGKTYLLNQDAFVEVLQNPNVSTDAEKVVRFLRKQQRGIQSLKPKTAFEKETLQVIKLAIDKVNRSSVGTSGE